MSWRSKMGIFDPWPPDDDEGTPAEVTDWATDPTGTPRGYDTGFSIEVPDNLIEDPGDDLVDPPGLADFEDGGERRSAPEGGWWFGGEGFKGAWF